MNPDTDSKSVGNVTNPTLPPDLQAKALEFVHALREYYSSVPAFAEGLLEATFGPEFKELPKYVARRYTETPAVVNCGQLQSEVYKAADLGFHIPVGIQEEIKRSCPTLNFPQIMSSLPDVISFGGSSILALAFLRGCSKLLETILRNRGEREIIIKAQDIAVHIKGSNDIDGAIRAFEEATSKTERALSRAHQGKPFAAGRPVRKS